MCRALPQSIFGIAVGVYRPIRKSLGPWVCRLVGTAKAPYLARHGECKGLEFMYPPTLLCRVNGV